MLLQTARQILTAALEAGHFEVVWWGCAALACLVVVVVTGGTRGDGDRHRRLWRAGRRLGMTVEETRVLHHLARAGHLRQETELFRNRALLDGVLQRGTAAVRRAGPPDRSPYRHRLAVLLSIKARVDAGSAASVQSLAPFRAGQPVTLARAMMRDIESRLLASIGDELACALPHDQGTSSAPLHRGMQVTVRAANSGGHAGGIVATVLGRAWVAGQPALLITRRTTLSGSVRARGGMRRCEIMPLAVDRRSIGTATPGAGEREPPVAGTLVSLDAQWAGIRAATPVAAGRLVRVAIEIGRAARLPLYGKVVQSPARRAAGVMVVHLTGLSRSRISDLYRFVDECWSAGGGARARD